MLLLDFITHETAEYTPPIDIARVRLYGSHPSTVAELQTMLETQYRHHIQHGYRLMVHTWARWEGFKLLNEIPYINMETSISA